MVQKFSLTDPESGQVLRFSTRSAQRRALKNIQQRGLSSKLQEEQFKRQSAEAGRRRTFKTGAAEERLIDTIQERERLRNIPLPPQEARAVREGIAVPAAISTQRGFKFTAATPESAQIIQQEAIEIQEQRIKAQESQTRQIRAAEKTIRAKQTAFELEQTKKKVIEQTETFGGLREPKLLVRPPETPGEEFIRGLVSPVPSITVSQLPTESPTQSLERFRLAESKGVGNVAFTRPPPEAFTSQLLPPEVPKTRIQKLKEFVKAKDLDVPFQLLAAPVSQFEAIGADIQTKVKDAPAIGLKAKIGKKGVQAGAFALESVGAEARQRPIQSTALFGVSAGAGFLFGTAAKTVATFGRTAVTQARFAGVVAGTEIGLGASFIGVTGLETALAPTVQRKKEIVGQSIIGGAGFGLGAGASKAIPKKRIAVILLSPIFPVFAKVGGRSAKIRSGRITKAELRKRSFNQNFNRNLNIQTDRIISRKGKETATFFRDVNLREPTKFTGIRISRPQGRRGETIMIGEFARSVGKQERAQFEGRFLRGRGEPKQALSRRQQQVFEQGRISLLVAGEKQFARVEQRQAFLKVQRQLPPPPKRQPFVPREPNLRAIQAFEARQIFKQLPKVESKRVPTIFKEPGQLRRGFRPGILQRRLVAEQPTGFFPTEQKTVSDIAQTSSSRISDILQKRKSKKKKPSFIFDEEKNIIDLTPEQFRVLEEPPQFKQVRFQTIGEQVKLKPRQTFETIFTRRFDVTNIQTLGQQERFASIQAQDFGLTQEQVPAQSQQFRQAQTFSQAFDFKLTQQPIDKLITRQPTIQQPKINVPKVPDIFRPIETPKIPRPPKPPRPPRPPKKPKPRDDLINIPGLPDFPKLKGRKRTFVKKEVGWDVLIKEKGKLVKGNKKALPEVEAERLMFDILENSLSASGKIVRKKVQVPSSRRSKLATGFFNRKNFRKSKDTGKAEFFVEKRSARLNTPGEVNEIQASKLLKSRNNQLKGIIGIGGL